MELGRLTNRELDELGRQLVIAAKPDEGEIDALVSNAGLYDGVLAKIAAASEAPAGTQPRHSAWRTVPAAALAAALVAIPLLAYLKFSSPGEAVVKKPAAMPYEVKERPFVPEIASPQPSVKEDQQVGPIHAVATRVVESAPPPKDRRERAVQMPVPEPAYEPIGLVERAEDAALDGRVVRVEIPRAALFAMGVDVPLENGTRSVKADLLLGADGSPRAIRLVE